MNSSSEKPAYISIETPIKVLDCKKPFESLDSKGKNYCYYFTRASWEGHKVCYFYKSYESPALFYLICKIFSMQSTEEVKQLCIKNGFSEEDWKKLTLYLAAFLQNCGNYSSFGDYKFIPEIPKQQFYQFLKLTEAYNLDPIKFDSIWESIHHELYEYRKPYGSIGLIDKGGLSGYYSPNMTEADVRFSQEFLDSIGMSALNTRVIKYSDQHYQILVCSCKSGGKVYEYKGVKFGVLYGDFNEFMVKVVHNLKECAKYVANDTQKEMFKHYIDHFETGNVESHKKSQRAWIKDKSPEIETNIGFNEHYLDPLKFRGEFIGLVTIQNKEQTALLNNLVNNAQELLKKLDWPKEYVREALMKPDFTSLEVLTSATYRLFSGINLPNYDEIRNFEGFKNVNLANCYPTPDKKTAHFVKDEDLDLVLKYTANGFFVKVALHELLGHGSGRLFYRDQDGKFNFDKGNIKNPFTGEVINTWYEHNETWYTKFGTVCSAYEECRADSIAMFLSTFNESLEILLPGREKEWDDIIYVAWYDMLLAGLRGLSLYIAETKLWGQAHTAGRYAILKVCLEAGNNFVRIEETERDGKPYLYLHLDRSQIKTTGRKAIQDFIFRLQVYKSTGDVQGGTKFFNEKLEVDEKFLKYREIVMQQQAPRPIVLQHDLRKNDKGEIEYVSFEPSPEGVIESYVFHHKDTIEDVYPLWNIYKDMFRYKA